QVAVRTAAAAFIHQAHAGRIVTEELVLPVQRAREAVADLVTRTGGDFFIGVEAVLVAEARARGGAGQRTDFGRMSVGVTDVPRPGTLVRPRLGQAEGELLGTALAGVVDQEDVVVSAVAAEALIRVGPGTANGAGVVVQLTT